MMPFTTEPVVVIRHETTYDDLGEPVETTHTEETLDVLVQPGSTADLDETRPNGVTVSYTLHFPKGYEKPLKGCHIKVRGVTYEVVGDPQPYTPSNTPGEWNMPVEVTRTDG